MSCTHLYNENFKSSVENSPIALVDFWATWCNPCRMIAPIVEEISDELDGTLDIFKVDVDEAPEIAAQYRVMSIPTIMLFKNGEEIDRIVGYRSKEDLMSIIQKYL